MSSDLQEVRDPLTLANLQSFLQSIPLINDPSVQWHIRQVLETTENYDHSMSIYYVELMNNVGMLPLRGIVTWQNRQLYLDVQSMLLLVDLKITAALDAFNAGHHWRYKGL